MLFPGNEDGGAQRRFAHLPNPPRLDIGVAPHRARLPEGQTRLGECFRDSVSVFRGVGPKLAQQKAAPFGQQQHIVDRQVLAQHVVDHQAIEAFQPDRLVLEYRRHVVGSDEGIGKSQHHQPAMLRAMFELAARLQHGNASAFACPPARGLR